MTNLITDLMPCDCKTCKDNEIAKLRKALRWIADHSVCIRSIYKASKALRKGGMG